MLFQQSYRHICNYMSFYQLMQVSICISILIIILPYARLYVHLGPSVNSSHFMPSAPLPPRLRWQMLRRGQPGPRSRLAMLDSFARAAHHGRSLRDFFRPWFGQHGVGHPRRADDRHPSRKPAQTHAPGVLVELSSPIGRYETWSTESISGHAWRKPTAFF